MSYNELLKFNTIEILRQLKLLIVLLDVRLLGILETNLSGRRTRNDRNILKSTSTLASANTVIELMWISIFR